jgi:pimeloyl-ACP methyl ester carboxylesterase
MINLILASLPRTRRSHLLIGLVLLATSGCATHYATFLADASFNTPTIETIRTSSGDDIDLYSIEVGPAPRRALFFASGSGCASLSYYMRSYFTGLTGSWKIYAAQKAGVARSDTGFFCGQKFEERYNYEVLEAQNGTALDEVIRRHGEVAGLIGVSEGGDIAAELTKTRPNVPRLVIIGSGGLPFRALAPILDARRDDHLFEHAFTDVDADPGSVTKSVLGYPYRYWSSVLKMDPVPIYLSLNIPILMIFGERDQSVPVASARVLDERFRAAKKDNFHLLVVPGASHGLTEGAVDHKPEIMTVIAAFLQGEE